MREKRWDNEKRWRVIRWEECGRDDMRTEQRRIDENRREMKVAGKRRCDEMTGNEMWGEEGRRGEEGHDWDCDEGEIERVT